MEIEQSLKQHHAGNRVFAAGARQILQQDAVNVRDDHAQLAS
ncbi:MAG: hypothetical protein ACOH2M_18975 [Cypionkella sp.]